MTAQRLPAGFNLRSHLEVPDIDRAIHPIDPWRWIETSPQNNALGVSETLFALSNGYLGMRGTPEEGRDTQVHGTFVNGLHETWHIQHAEQAYGLAHEGQAIVDAPDVKSIRIYVDDEPLRVGTADLEHFERHIDFREGILRRNLIWRTPSGKRVEVTTTRMISMDEKHLSVMTYEVTLPDDAAPVVISTQLLNRQDGEDEYHVSGVAHNGRDPRRNSAFSGRVFEPRLQRDEGERMTLGYQCTNSRMTVAVSMDHRMETDNDYEQVSYIGEDAAKVVYSVHAKAGQTIKLTKMAAYHTSRSVPVRELGYRCGRTIKRGWERGVEDLQLFQRYWLEDFWKRSDVEVAGEPGTQQAIRWNLFQLAQAAGRAETSGIAAKGVTGSGYGGHYFWDTETYVMPFLTYTSPHLARNALRFRYSLLDAARRRAEELDHKGALFPWRTINGEEASAYYAAGTAQYHINADIAHALVQYLNATGDTDFLVREGVDILVETARLFLDLGFMAPDGHFHIHGVTGPDEYTTVVDNNLYTNVMARFNLTAAAEAIEAIERSSPEAMALIVDRLSLSGDEPLMWRAAADAMFIALDPELGVHPQDQHFLDKEVWDKDLDAPRRPLLLHFHPLVIYRHQVLKQADVVLALFLRGDEFTLEEKRADFDYYDPLTTGDSTLSAVVQSIIAAEIGYCDDAMDLFNKALVVDLADVHGNTTDGVHVASTGGVWSALVCGFGGFRDHRGRLTLDPRLPEEWSQLTFRLTIHGSRLKVTVGHEEIRLEIEDGTEVSLAVWDSDVVVRAGTPEVLPRPRY